MNQQELLNIGIQKRNGEIPESWDELAKKYGLQTGEAFRKWVKRRTGTTPHKEKPLTEINYKESTEIHTDGSQSSNKLLRMSIDDTKDADYLLRAHGYDTGKWELTSARSNIWNSYSDKSGIMQLYSSKISVKPRKESFTLDKLVEAMNVQPVIIDVDTLDIQDKRMLEIPLFDAHFGISDFEYYRPTQARIATKLMGAKWEETLFIIGQDMLHNDNFKGETSNGTKIETVDMVQAWEDAIRFYTPLIELSIKQSQRVKVIYSKGNHDLAMSWALVQLLKSKYPQVAVDDEVRERKAHTFGYNFIGVTHGDKARKNLHNIFPIEFPLEWSRAKNREIHTGHYHIEESKDIFGMVVRTLSTRNKTDVWHKDNGFVGGHKRFTLFEYSETELESIHYV